MNFTTEIIAETSLNIELAKGIQAYNEGRISKFKLNKLYEAVINDAFTFFQKEQLQLSLFPEYQENMVFF